MVKKIIALALALPLIAFNTNAFAADTAGIDKLNELLRGEISAVETYRQALEKLADEPGAADLRKSLEDHKTAAKDIRAEVVRLGGTPTKDSGAWGIWAKTITSSAKVLGDTVALKALKEGEDHGVKEYYDTLADASVPKSFKDSIKSDYLPNQQKHIDVIEKMLQQVS